MSRLFTLMLFVGSLAFVGCDQKAPSNPVPAPDRPRVDVQAPGVDVKAGKDGTTVRTPGADVDINKK